MPISSARILDLVAQPPDSGVGGTCEALIRQLQRERQGSGTGQGPLGGRHVDFLNALRDRPADKPGTSAIYRHPGRSGDQVRRAPHPRNADGTTREPTPYALSAADVAWLSRLPDPAQMTYADAEQLGILAAQVTAASDVRLVESLWAPVRRIHDRAAAEFALRTAQRPDSQFPEVAAVAAVEEALAVEVVELTPAERASRARRLVSEALATRAGHRAARIAAAEDALRAATAEPEISATDAAVRDHAGKVAAAGTSTL